MSNSKWRTYGGTNKLEKLNNITTNSLITETFTLRNAYYGNFDICGSLIITDNIYVGIDAFIQGNTDISNILTVVGNTILNSNVFIQDNAYLANNLFVTNDIVVDGSVNIYNELFMGNHKQNYLYGNITGIGINTHTPAAILDINGPSVAILNVYSSAETNTNIIARNKNQHGIVVSTSDISSAIQFYNDDK